MCSGTWEWFYEVFLVRISYEAAIKVLARHAVIYYLNVQLQEGSTLDPHWLLVQKTTS